MAKVIFQIILFVTLLGVLNSAPTSPTPATPPGPAGSVRTSSSQPDKKESSPARIARAPHHDGTDHSHEDDSHDHPPRSFTGTDDVKIRALDSVHKNSNSTPAESSQSDRRTRDTKTETPIHLVGGPILLRGEPVPLFQPEQPKTPASDETDKKDGARTSRDTQNQEKPQVQPEGGRQAQPVPPDPTTGPVRKTRDTSRPESNVSSPVIPAPYKPTDQESPAAFHSPPDSKNHRSARQAEKPKVLTVSTPKPDSKNNRPARQAEKPKVHTSPTPKPKQ